VLLDAPLYVACRAIAATRDDAAEGQAERILIVLSTELQEAKMNDKRNIVCVGVSQNHDSAQAGREAAQMVTDLLAHNESVAWALAFCGGRHDPGAVLQGLRSQLGEVEIVGGSAVGTITNRLIGYTGYEFAVAAFPSSLPKPAIVVAGGLEMGEAKVGQQLGAKLRDVAQEGDTVLIFYDSVQSGPPPVLYTGSQLMDGIYASLAGKHLNLIGSGTVGDLQLTQSYVLDGHQAVKHTAVAVVLPSILQSHTTIMHGCIPVSSFLEITRIDGPVVYELDGRPALEIILEMTGQEQDPGDLSLFVTLGEKYGDPYAPYDESAYVNRLILGSNPQDGSVTLFEADFQTGTKVQIMSRDNQLMVESVHRQTKKLIESLDQAAPVFALYIDCAGRARAFSGAEVEEASVLQAELGADIPLLGFYSGVEIAPLLGRSRPLDWTGVLTLFTLEDAHGRP
jgi:hypothetical protein